MDKGILGRLATDTRGNALMIFAGALVPMLVMVGSGLDMGVTYMAQAKLQNACDAGVLAGRQAMLGERWTTADETETRAQIEARKFFDFNFPSGTNGVDDVSFTVTQNPDDGSELLGTATGTVPTTLMNIFGYNSMPISATCDATRDMGHNDVMMVLDVTGSMSQAASGGGIRIDRLRSGAIGLYRALADEKKGSITRFGMLPYSHTVNVARSLGTDDILRNTTYITGEWDYRQCKVNSRNQLYDCVDKTQGSRPAFGWDNTSNGWRYNINVEFDQSGTRNVNIKDTIWNRSDNENNSIDAFRNSGNGCIEERRTVGQSGYVIRDAVTRQDIDTRFSGSTWNLRFGRYDPASQNGHTQDGCPAEATPLQPYDSETAFNTAVNNATARVTGGTYHDVGMLWGTRFLSRTGFFAADNPTQIDNIPVNQHIVFMTDGFLDTGETLYSAHGVERYYNRTQGSGNTNARHIRRFLSSCEQARAMGITIWVIVLDEGDTGNIEPCATSPEHFYMSDGSDLEKIFEAIGQGIGNLRLTR